MNIMVLNFTIADYMLFFGIASISIFIGIYFGCFGNKQISLNDYLFGGKNVKIFPVVLSIISSFISGPAILGIPTEIYQFGPYYWFTSFAFIIVFTAAIHITLPVFYELQLVSVFEYLQLRFDRRTQKLCSTFFTFQSLILMSLALYCPAVALSIGTNINFHTLTITLCLVCIFYTTLGGFKAVIWNDTLQFFIKAACLISVAVLGTIKEGGILNIFKLAYENDRLSLDFDINPTKRDTFWTATIGLISVWSIAMVVPITIQKFQSLPTFEDVKIAARWCISGIFFFITIITYIGYVTSTSFYGCDPKTSGKIKRIDQLLPYYVLKIAGDIPGFAGLFMAGIFSASLSTLSTFLNSLSGTIHKDFIFPVLPKNFAESEIIVNLILKTIVIVIGILCVGLVFLLTKLGDALPLIVALPSVVMSPLVAIFLLGMLTPKCNANGAFWGGLLSFIILLVICSGNYYYSLEGYIIPHRKPISIKECGYTININSTTQFEPEKIEVFYLYRISFFYYGFIGILLTIIFGMLISKVTSCPYKYRKDLISPVIHWVLPETKEYTSLLIQNEDS